MSQSRLLSATILTLIGLVSTVSAQDAGVLDEITVTAQKRAESIQDVSISMAVLDSDAVDQTRELNDIISLVPNVALTGFSQNQNVITIRAVGSGDDGAAGDAATAVHYDGIFVARDGARDIVPFDMARVEILRGPQGTLYGKNAVAGAVNYVPNRPDGEFDASVQLTAGSDSLFELRGMVNGSLGETASGRLAFNTTDRDGYSTNLLTGNDIGGLENRSIRGGLKFEPSDTFDIYIGADFSTDDGSGHARKLDPNFGDKFLPIPFIPGIPNTVSDVHKIEVNTDGNFERDIAGLTLELNKDLGAGVLTWLSGYRELSYSTFYDLDGSAQDWVVQNIDEDSDQISTELRFASAPADVGGFEYVAGLFYMTVDTDRHEFNDFYDGLINPFAPGAPPIDTRVSWIQANKTDSFAAFAEFKFQMSERFALRVGGRFSEDKKDFTMTTTCSNHAGVVFTRGPDIPVPPFQTGGPGLAGTCLANVVVPSFTQATYDAAASDSWSNFSGKIALEYSPSDDMLFYLTFNQGFKSGGFPPSGTTQLVAETPFFEELADNVELGSKTTFADGRINLNVALFFTDYNDLQVGVLDPVSGALFIENAADATSKGVEVDFAYSANDVFTLYASYAFTDATYDDFINGGVDVSGEPLRGPKNSGNLRAEFDWGVGAGGSMIFAAEVNYKDEFYQLPVDPRQLFPARTLVNANLRYVSANGNWDVFLWGRNLTDEEEVLQTVPPPGGLSARLYGPPTTYGATFTWRY